MDMTIKHLFLKKSLDKNQQDARLTIILDVWTYVTYVCVLGEVARLYESQFPQHS